MRSYGNHRASRLCVLVLAGAALTAIQPASAFDGQRRGFILAFGGGIHITDVDFDFDNIDDPSDFPTGDDVGFALQLSIGGAITDHFALSLTHQVFQAEVNNADFNNFFLGATATAWLSPSSPSLYGSVSLGRHRVNTDAFDSGFFGFDDSENGNAARVAIGFEFANRFQIEGGIIFAEADDGFQSGDPEVQITSGHVIASYVWY